MAVTAAMIARVRKMVAEPTMTTYLDANISAFIEAYPMLDADGLAPGETGYAADTYNLAAAAADILEEKAAAAATNYDFSADGSSFKQNQVADRWLELAKMYRGQRVKGARLLP